jgi:hypothetical protein
MVSKVTQNIRLEFFNKEGFLCSSVLNISEYKFAFPYLVTTDVFNSKEGITAVLVATSQNGVPVFPFERGCDVSKHHTSSASTCAVHYLMISEGVSKILFICL